MRLLSYDVYIPSPGDRKARILRLYKIIGPNLKTSEELSKPGDRVIEQTQILARQVIKEMFE